MKLLLIVLFQFIGLLTYCQQLPRIIILATGGTIAGQGASNDRAYYEPGKIPIEDLIGTIPSVKKIANISGEQISSIGSEDMTIEIWKKLAVRCNEIFEKNEADGIVITHGTDTQEETAYFLRLVLKSNKPVVLTGSMRPATAISADGPKNLFDAITVAASANSRGKGVMLSFNESIYHPRDVMKISTTKVNGFYAPNTGPIGQVYDGKVEFYQASMRETEQVAPFKVDMNTNFPRVDIVYMYADASGDVIDYLVSRKVDGLIIAGVGNGNFNKAYTEAIKRATAGGVIVVRASRAPTGRVVLENEAKEKEMGTVVSDVLTPQKARVLLMLALTQNKDRNNLQQYFYKY